MEGYQMKATVSIFALVFLFLLTASTSLMAQKLDRTGAIEWGIKAGLNLATATGDDAEFEDEESGTTLSPETRMGFTGGLFMTYYFSEQFAFQPELLYSQKGTSYNFDMDIMGVIAKYDMTVKYDYIDIPLLAKIIFPIQNFGNVNLHIGPSAGIKLLSEADTKVELSGMVNETTDTTFVNEEAKDFVFNLVFGAGIGFDTDFGTISLEGRYNMGMMGPDGKAEGEDEEPDVRLNAISILVSIAFK
jgi:hypothetical protein